ncbi:hypothetical protein [Roseinatronobacter sp.]
MTGTVLHHAGRAGLSLHRTGFLIPAAGLAAMSVSVYAMSAVALTFPEVALVPDGMTQCTPFDGDFGCGHGFGCACHMLPIPETPV